MTSSAIEICAKEKIRELVEEIEIHSMSAADCREIARQFMVECAEITARLHNYEMIIRCAKKGVLRHSSIVETIEMSGGIL